MAYEITLRGERAHAVEVVRHGARATVTIDGRDFPVALRAAGDGRELTFESTTIPMWALLDGDTIWIHAFGRAWELSLVDPVERVGGTGASDDVASAPMPGTVINVWVAPGDEVSAGQPLVVIESMKMQSEIVAMRDGVVDQVLVAVGDTFDRGAPLASLLAAATDTGDDDGGDD